MDFIDFINHLKLAWMAPILLALLALSLLILYAESAVLSPFLYALF